jgi:hypothetical protein
MKLAQVCGSFATAALLTTSWAGAQPAEGAAPPELGAPPAEGAPAPPAGDPTPSPPAEPLPPPAPPAADPSPPLATPPVAPLAPAPSKLDATLEKLDLSGDLRLRQELDTNRETSSGQSQKLRQRPRLRLRLNLAFKANDEIEMVARLTTGAPDDVPSPYQTFGDANQKFAFYLDRAYMKYAPSWAPGLALTAGKLPHPFLSSAIYPELIQDADVQPSGATLTYELPDGQVKPYVGVAHYLLLEQNTPANADVTLTAGQVGAKLDASGIAATAAVAGYLYRSPTADGATTLVAQNRGNASEDRDGDGTADHFVSRFRIVHAFADVGMRDGLAPVLSGGAFTNLGADDDATGWFAGAAVGKGKKAGEVRGYAQYQHVARDSVYSPYVQDDFLLATGFKGVVGGVKVMLYDWLDLHGWALLASRDRNSDGSPGGWQHRYRLDLTGSF